MNRITEWLNEDEHNAALLLTGAVGFLAGMVSTALGVILCKVV
jgi:hypothetical protein